MPHADEMSRLIGALEGAVSAGFQGIYHRMEAHDRQDDDRHREMLTYVWRLHSRIDKRKNGNGIPYAKIATILGLIILGTLGHIAPEAVRSAIAKILLTQMGG